ncbi:hypothetical protein ABPG75_005895 [Micractinium tetrahymenae]
MSRSGAARPLAAAALFTVLCLGTALEDGNRLPYALTASGEPQPPAAGSDNTGAGQPPAAAEPLIDDSVRCRLSCICDSPPAICNGTAAGSAEQGHDTLACVTDDEGRAAAVQEAARHAWSGYRDCAWGEDELRPLSCSGVHWLNLSLTMVDSLDTLHLLGLRREFEEAAEWLSTHLDVGAPGEVNLFETTIRVLGGLLSAQVLSARSHPALSRRLAEKAADLGARLMPAFNSPSGVPYSDVNLRTGEASPPSWGHISSLSEMCSVSLEFTYLARITGHAAFEEVPLKVHDLLEAHATSAGGLLGQFFNPLTGKAHKEHRGTITLGARSDSYYEYLKQWLLTGKSEGWLRERYVQAMRSVRSRLLKRTAPAGRPGLWYVAEQLPSGQLSSKMDHLVCFLPGLLALGDFHNVSTQHSVPPGMEHNISGTSGSESRECNRTAEGVGSCGTGISSTVLGSAEDPAAAAQAAPAQASQASMPQEQSAEGMADLELAHELALSCYELYRRTPAGLAPEIAHFANNSVLQDFPNKHVHDVGRGDYSIKPNDAHNLLRPESVESFYILWKVTGDPQYKHWAWQVFRAFQKWARVRPEDRQEHCSSCLSEAAAEAARLAAAAASEGSSAGGSSSGDGSEGSSSGGGDDASTTEARRARAVAAAAEVLQRQLRGGEVCAACSNTGGYSSLESVLAVPPPRRDKMESFFLAETLKYLYLIFTEPPDRCLHPSCQPAAAQPGQPGGGSRSSAGDASAEAEQQRQQQAERAGDQASELHRQQQPRQELLPLDRFVFTTEAHPLPVVGSAAASAVAWVLDPDSPLLRPFDEGQCSLSSTAGTAGAAGGGGGATPVQQRAAAAAAAVKKAAAAARRRARDGGNTKAQLLEAALEHMLQRLADAAAAITGQPSLPESGSGGGAGAAGQAAAAAAAAAEEDEEDPYEEVESDEGAEETDPYEDPPEEEGEGGGEAEEGETDPYDDPPDS